VFFFGQVVHAGENFLIVHFVPSVGLPDGELPTGVRCASRPVTPSSLLRPRAPRSGTAERDTRYWQLMRSGLSNAAACKVLGVCRQTGVRIRASHHQQTPAVVPPAGSSGRYLSLRERCRIADLLRLDCSLRAIAAELGRAPSTIKTRRTALRRSRPRWPYSKAERRADDRDPRPRHLGRDRSLRRRGRRFAFLTTVVPAAQVADQKEDHAAASFQV
jgi:DNA-binding CsgD family transcriptional regulator